MIVDAHQHLWRLDRGYRWLDEPALAPLRRDFTVSDLRAALAGAALAGTAVTGTVLVEAGRCEAAEVGEFLALAEATEEIVGVVGWVDLADPGLADLLAAHRAGRGGRWLVGARAQVQAEPDPDYLRRGDVLRGLAAVADAGLCYDLVVRVDQLPAAGYAAAAVPQLTFVLDHLGKPAVRDGAAGLAAWRAAVARLAAAPNVVAKLSGLITEAPPGWRPAQLRPFVHAALELFGPSRLMFGSDWPVCLLATGAYADVPLALEKALGGGPTPAEREEIYHGTAVRAYRLPC